MPSISHQPTTTDQCPWWCTKEASSQLDVHDPAGGDTDGSWYRRHEGAVTAPQGHELELEQLVIVEADGSLRPEPAVVYIDGDRDNPLTADVARRMGQQLLLAAEVLDGTR